METEIILYGLGVVLVQLFRTERKLGYHNATLKTIRAKCPVFKEGGLSDAKKEETKAKEVLEEKD